MEVRIRRVLAGIELVAEGVVQVALTLADGHLDGRATSWATLGSTGSTTDSLMPNARASRGN